MSISTYSAPDATASPRPDRPASSRRCAEMAGIGGTVATLPPEISTGERCRPLTRVVTCEYAPVREPAPRCSPDDRRDLPRPVRRAGGPAGIGCGRALPGAA